MRDTIMPTDHYTLQYCVWELTLKCNMNCLHCGSRAGRERHNELNNHVALDVADQLLDLGCRHVSFIGGEVFLYHGWEKIARRLTDADISVNIISNGLAFGQKQLDEIRYAGLSNVALSLDGLEANHNRIRNHPNSFGQLMHTIDLLNRANIPVGVNTTLLDCNVGDLEALYVLLLDRGVKIWQLQLANPMGNLSGHKELLITLENIAKLTAFIREKREENRIRLFTGDNIGYYDQHEPYIRGMPGNINYWSGCQAGLTVVGIDSIGNVKGCESLYDDYFIEGNLRQETLRDIWHKEGNFAYNRNFTPELLGGKCKTCDMGVFCRAGCRGACFFTKGHAFENACCIYNPPL